LETEFATETGGKTIQMTAGGRILSVLDMLRVPSRFQEPFWRWGSRHFASEASGSVNVFLTRAGESGWHLEDY